MTRKELVKELKKYPKNMDVIYRLATREGKNINKVEKLISCNVCEYMVGDHADRCKGCLIENHEYIMLGSKE